MSDVSSNEIFDDSELIDDSDDSSESEVSDVSDNEVSSDTENENENESTTAETVVVDSYDYSHYFENLQTIGILISAEILALGIAFAFFKGLKK